jgi:adenosylmethionine-8-amino-7-oxononanoate aminotransferase
MNDYNDYKVWELLLPPQEQGAPGRRVTGAYGHRITFAEGGPVLDGTSGLWNVNLGYGNQAIANAVHKALIEASYLTLFRYGHDYAADAASALIEAAGGRYSRVLFSTSGGAANDAVMKLARQYAVLREERDRRLVIGLRDSYHGQTYGAFALTGEDLGQAMYGADLTLVRHVSRSDSSELAGLLATHGPQVAAVVVEPVLGTGAHALTTDMVEALDKLRRQHGFLLVCDEVATGFGRTGTMFASSTWTAAPDVLITSKGLTNGTCAAAAALIAHHVYAEFERANMTFVHGETQAGTPPTCAAILATLQQFKELDALPKSRRNGQLLDNGLREIAEHNELVSEVTGAGCFRGLHLRLPGGQPLWSHHVTQVIEAIRIRGALVHPGPSAIQVVPALTFREQEVADLLGAVDAGLHDFMAARLAKRSAIKRGDARHGQRAGSRG